MLFLPAFDVGVVGQAAHVRQCVIDVAVLIVVLQLLIAAEGGGNTNFLRSPIEISSDLAFRENHE